MLALTCLLTTHSALHTGHSNRQSYTSSFLPVQSAGFALDDLHQTLTLVNKRFCPFAVE
jgi:hypothetical protein